MKAPKRQNSLREELMTPDTSKDNKTKKSNEKNVGSYSGTSSYLRMYQNDEKGNKDEIQNSSVLEECYEDSPPQLDKKKSGLSALQQKFSHLAESDSGDEKFKSCLEEEPENKKVEEEQINTASNKNDED